MGFNDYNDPVKGLARAAEMYYDEERYMAEAEKDDIEGEDLEHYAARAMSDRQQEDMKKLKEKAFVYGREYEDLRKEKLGHVEPAPTPTGGASMHDLVIEDMAKRKEFGLAKYGTLLQAGNGRDALMDAYEEVLDLAVYLRQAIEERYPQRYVKGLDTEVSGDES